MGSQDWDQDVHAYMWWHMREYKQIKVQNTLKRACVREREFQSYKSRFAFGLFSSQNEKQASQASTQVFLSLLLLGTRLPRATVQEVEEQLHIVYPIDGGGGGSLLPCESHDDCFL